MPITYRIDKNLGVVFSAATGILTDTSLLRHKDRVVNDPDFSEGFVELADMRAMERFVLVPESIESFAAKDKALSDRLKDYRLAIVVTGEYLYGVALQYRALTKPTVPGVEVFREMEKARAWLGLEEHPEEKETHDPNRDSAPDSSGRRHVL